MARTAGDYRRYAPVLILPVVFLMNIGLSRGFGALLRPIFWESLGLGLLGLALLAGVVAVGFITDRRFCLWFDRAHEAARLRIDDRVAARSGLIAWPISDPLHDPEVDG